MQFHVEVHMYCVVHATQRNNNSAEVDAKMRLASPFINHFFDFFLRLRALRGIILM
jgi:hypothetical protein